MNAQTKVESDNLALWNTLRKTDPRQTKQFSRAGGFKGTAIKPIWVVQRLTEIFGPCGKGWGMDEPSFQTVPGDNREVLVYCTVSGWYISNGDRCVVYGVGGDKAVTHIKANEKFNRPERWENDDEAFKKAFTDAVGNAFKFLGVGADVHMGQFDDSKYVQEVGREFVEAEQAALEHAQNYANNGEPQKVVGITKIKERLRTLQTAGDALTDLEAFNEMLAANRDDLTTIKDANHAWWTGDGADFEGFRAWILRRRAELSEPREENQFSVLVESLNKCETKIQLQNWLATHGDAVEMLDGEESRKFELAYQFRESIINEMDKVHS